MGGCPGEQYLKQREQSTCQESQGGRGGQEPEWQVQGGWLCWFCVVPLPSLYIEHSCGNSRALWEGARKSGGDGKAKRLDGSLVGSFLGWQMACPVQAAVGSEPGAREEEPGCFPVGKPFPVHS